MSTLPPIDPHKISSMSKDERVSISQFSHIPSDIPTNDKEKLPFFQSNAQSFAQLRFLYRLEDTKDWDWWQDIKLPFKDGADFTAFHGSNWLEWSTAMRQTIADFKVVLIEKHPFPSTKTPMLPAADQESNNRANEAIVPAWSPPPMNERVLLGSDSQYALLPFPDNIVGILEGLVPFPDKLEEQLMFVRVQIALKKFVTWRLPYEIQDFVTCLGEGITGTEVWMWFKATYENRFRPALIRHPLLPHPYATVRDDFKVLKARAARLYTLKGSDFETIEDFAKEIEKMSLELVKDGHDIIPRVQISAFVTNIPQRWLPWANHYVSRRRQCFFNDAEEWCYPTLPEIVSIARFSTHSADYLGL